MLVTLAEMKISLGLAVTTYDTFLTEQITLVSDTVEAYCRRVFNSTMVSQTYYGSGTTFNGWYQSGHVPGADYLPSRQLQTFHYPLISVTSVTEDSVVVDPTIYRIHKPTGTLIRTDGTYFFQALQTVVAYTTGFSAVPTPIVSVVKALVEERYNKKTSGVALNFGNEVQSISVPGAIAVDFDYSLTANDRNTPFGMILGNNLNVLDYYRSDRAILGNSKLIYVG